MRHLPKWMNPKVFYSRLLLWTDTFKSMNTLVFLDADLFFLDSIEELTNSTSFTMVRDYYSGENSILETSDPDLNEMLSSDEIVLPKYGANAGVFALPREYRFGNYRKSLFDLLARYRKHLTWADQTLLNLWMIKNGIDSADFYTHNFQSRLLFDRQNATKGSESVKIIHLNGVTGWRRRMIMQVLRMAQKTGLSSSAIVNVASLLLRSFAPHPDRSAVKLTSETVRRLVHSIQLLLKFPGTQKWVPQ